MILNPTYCSHITITWEHNFDKRLTLPPTKYFNDKRQTVSSFWDILTDVQNLLYRIYSSTPPPLRTVEINLQPRAVISEVMSRANGQLSQHYRDSCQIISQPHNTLLVVKLMLNYLKKKSHWLHRMDKIINWSNILIVFF